MAREPPIKSFASCSQTDTTFKDAVPTAAAVSIGASFTPFEIDEGLNVS